VTLLERLQGAARSRFTRNALTILVGTVLAQVFPLVASPVLTRMYTPDDFGVFGLFYSLSLMLSVLASLRFNVAVVLPADRQAAAQLVGVGLASTLGVSLLVLGIALFAGEPLSDLMGVPEFAPYMPWVVLAGALLSAYSVGYAWMNRESMFRSMAASRVVQTGGVTLAQLAAGAAGAGSIGLVGGLLAGQVAGNVLPAKAVKEPLGMVTKNGLREQAKRYRRFPALSMPADLINSAANQLPVILLTSFFGLAVAGLYNLTVRVAAAPAQLLQTAVLDAFRQRAASDFAETGSCRPIFLKTLAMLTALGILPAVLLFTFGPDLFSIIFGEEWREAGEYARLLVPKFFFGFVVSPLAYTLYISEQQHIDLAWQVGLFALVNGAVVGGAIWGGARLAVALFSAAYSVMYILYLGLSYRASVQRTLPSPSL